MASVLITMFDVDTRIYRSCIQSYDTSINSYPRSSAGKQHIKQMQMKCYIVYSGLTKLIKINF